MKGELMLNEATTHAVLGVSDLEQAKQFYGETLGLRVEKEREDGVYYRAGNSHFLIYPTSLAGTNQATAIGFETDNPEEVVEDLKGKGITFERYDNIPGVTREGDIHHSGDMKAAWFKDPFGNVICVANEV
jgi:catechol 2,3-dioxygenase-like lactoylglutathione lyase family enzyme